MLRRIVFIVWPSPLKIIEPVLMEKFLENALEVEIDALCDGKDIFICGLVEHIHPAGIHSGDSMCFTSPYRIEKRLQKELVEQTGKIGKTLKVVTLFNVQFAKDRKFKPFSAFFLCGGAWRRA